MPPKCLLMSEHQAARTLVKSAPELWMACSEEASLARHLKPFGEIRITRLEPETAVAWEGERASGTVRLEPSGWGTKVTLTAWEVEPPIAELPEPAVAELAEPAVAEAQEPAEGEPESDVDSEPVAVAVAVEVPVAPAARWA